MLLLKAKLIVTMNPREEILKDAYIGIDEESGKIIYVGKDKPEYETIIDLGDKIILPGFINAHTHVPMVLLRGLKDDVDLQTWLFKYIFPAEDLLRAQDIYYGALQGIAEMIESGTTMFFDMYFYEEEIARAVKETGIRAILSRGILDFPEGRSPETEIRKSVDFLEYLRREWVQDKELVNRLFFAFGPHAPYTCSKELLVKIREKACELKSELPYVSVNIHVAETKNEFDEFVSKYRMTPIEYLSSIGFLDSDVLLIHSVWVSPNDLNIIKLRNAKVVHNPSSNLKLGSGIAPIPEMIDNGILVALGTDGAASNNRLDILWEARLAALLHKGIKRDPTTMPAKKVLEMITIDGAKALRLDRLVGSIEVGKFADLVILDLEKVLQGVPRYDIYSQIIYSLDLRAIHGVMVNGRWVYREGEFVAIRNLDFVREKISDIRNNIEENLRDVSLL